MRWYLDTSAAMRLIKREFESTALAERLRADRPDLISALLLETELRRAVHRHEPLTQETVSEFLATLSLSDMDSSADRTCGPWTRCTCARPCAAARRRSSPTTSAWGGPPPPSACR